MGFKLNDFQADLIDPIYISSRQAFDSSPFTFGIIFIQFSVNCSYCLGKEAFLEHEKAPI